MPLEGSDECRLVWLAEHTYLALMTAACGPEATPVNKAALATLLFNHLRSDATRKVKKKELTALSWTKLLDLALADGLISEATYKVSLPAFNRIVKCYLRTVLHPRLWDMTDAYVQFASKLAARGSLIANMWACDHHQCYNIISTSEGLLDATFMKHLMYPRSDLATVAPQLRDWLQMRVPDSFGALMGPDAGVNFSGVLDQTLNALVRQYTGNIKVHIKLHMPQRLVDMFEAIYREEQGVQRAAQAVLSNQLGRLTPDWAERVASFRADMMVPDGHVFGAAAAAPTTEDEQLQPEGAGEEEEDDDDEDADGEEDTVCRRTKAELQAVWPVHCALCTGSCERQATRSSQASGFLPATHLQLQTQLCLH
jgi:hypothetical protein